MTTTLDRPVTVAQVARPAVQPAELAHLDIAVCRSCADDLDHCHDTLVVHVAGELHCTAADCSTPSEVHALVVGCGELGCDCAPGSAVA